MRTAPRAPISLQRSNSSRKIDPPAKAAPALWKPLYPGEDESGLVIRSPPPIRASLSARPQNRASPPIKSGPKPDDVGIEAPLKADNQSETARSFAEKNPFTEWGRRNNSYIKSTISKDNTSAVRTEAQEGLQLLGQKLSKPQVYISFQFSNLMPPAKERFDVVSQEG
jgi:hypothetical protein